MTPSGIVRILFICSGNTCRSPTAEVVLRGLLEKAGLNERILVASAGTSIRHAGEEASVLAVSTAATYGYDLTNHRAKQIAADDYTSATIIIGMERRHVAHLQEGMEALDIGQHPACYLFLSPPPNQEGENVKDPYHGGIDDYAEAFKIIEAGCHNWLEFLRTYRAP